MSRKIQDVEGIGPKYGQLLQAQGITTTEQLLTAGGGKADRKKLAAATGISEAQILKWVNMCDLFRINGVASQFAELLENAGVDTVKELRNRNADNLAAKMAEVNGQKHLCKTTPGATTIAKWVEEAKGLSPMVTY